MPKNEANWANVIAMRYKGWRCCYLLYVWGETYLGGAGVYRKANQIRPITTRNIPTLTHALSLQSNMICPTHRGRLGAAQRQIVMVPP